MRSVERVVSAQRFRLALLLSGVVAVAALIGVLMTSPRPAVRNTGVASAATAVPGAAPAGTPAAGRYFGRGGFGCGAIVPGGSPAAPAFDGAFGFGMGCGDEGTVTGISGSSLTLRTLVGTVTVNTTSATTYAKEGRAIAFSDVHVGDVIAVRGMRPTFPATPPASPPTTVTATSVTVVLPTFVGRVASVSGPTIFIVTANGQMAYVYTTPATTYSSGGAAAAFGDVKAGVFVVAEGDQKDLTHLTADVVTIVQQPPGRHPAGKA